MGEEIDLAALSVAVARALPPLDDPQRRVVLATYQLISRAIPANPEALAPLAHMTPAIVARDLPGLPTASLDRGAVVGFLGLHTTPTTHRITFPEGSAGTWCAWDALFLPHLLGLPARVVSTCPVTGEPIVVEVDPADRVVAVSPDEARLSFLARPAPYAGDIVASSCRWVHFLASPAAAHVWTRDAARDGGEELVALDLDEGVTIGRRTNLAVFGATTAPTATPTIR